MKSNAVRILRAGAVLMLLAVLLPVCKKPPVNYPPPTRWRRRPARHPRPGTAPAGSRRWRPTRTATVSHFDSTAATATRRDGVRLLLQVPRSR